MKWIVLYSLAFTFILGLFGQESSNSISTNNLDYTVLVAQNTSEQVVYADLSCALKIVGEFEVEVEDDEENDDFESKYSTTYKLSLPRVLSAKSGISFFQETKPTKLYILFHSWKSFLSI